MTFNEWFHEATGFSPFPFQIRLAIDAAWPDALAVPTGLGKTAGIVLAWLWRRRFADFAVRSATPRRLVYCLPMRVLVEQTADNVATWLERLGLLASAPDDSRPVTGVAAQTDPSGHRIAVSLLMGGDVDDGWDIYPDRDAILIGTQDLLISRALNRGYAMSRYRWPMHFALVHNDVLWVFDEIQLMSAALPTSLQLEAMRRAWGTALPARSLWVSATLASDWLRTVDLNPVDQGFRMLELSDADCHVPIAQSRLTASKPIHFATTRFAVDADDAYGPALAEEVMVRHRPGTTTLVVVNRVARAQLVYQALRNQAPADTDILLIHARFRQSERRALDARLRQQQPSGGRIVVATQAVEAGVDFSARTLFTEIAPWASLVQRFGRCNRYGEAPPQGSGAAGIYIVDTDEELTGPHADEVAYPYRPIDLQEARAFVSSIADAMPATLPAQYRQPDPEHVLRRRDLLDLFDTTPDLTGADIDVSRYVRSTTDADVQVFWRVLPENWDRQTLPFPTPSELVAVSLAQLRRYLRIKIPGKTRKAFRWDVLAGRWVEVDPNRIYPGLELLLDAALGGYTTDLGFMPESTSPVEPLPESSLAPEDDAADPLSELPRFVSLSRDLEDTADEAWRLVKALLGHWEHKAVVRAALRHDVGKGCLVFQDTMTRCLSQDDPRRQELWAKSPCHGRHRRPHFRHELASALASFLDGEDDLVTYLVAAHHGKVRMSIRSFPDEGQDTAVRIARGVQDGDIVPKVVAGGNVFPQHVLTLDLLAMGVGPSGPSWTERALNLLDRYGPFTLAWMETMVRIADWRASRAELQSVGDGDQR